MSFFIAFSLISLSKKNILHRIDKYLKKNNIPHPKTIQEQLGGTYISLSNLYLKISRGFVDGASFLKLEKLITKNHQEMKVFLEILLDQKILILVAIRSDVGDYRKINEFTKDDKLNEFKNRI